MNLDRKKPLFPSLPIVYKAAGIRPVRNAATEKPHEARMVARVSFSHALDAEAFSINGLMAPYKIGNTWFATPETHHVSRDPGVGRALCITRFGEGSMEVEDEGSQNRLA